MNCQILFLVSLVLGTVVGRRRSALKVSAAQSFQMDPDTCILYPEYEFFLHENCDQFWECDEFNELVEGFCPPEFPVFDAEYYFCGKFVI